jgi:hypothetical protein
VRSDANSKTIVRQIVLCEVGWPQPTPAGDMTKQWGFQYLCPMNTFIPAMLLADGRGCRMRLSTDHARKPLLTVRGNVLMQRPMEVLLQGNFLS